jgi:hypothetical protein
VLVSSSVEMVEARFMAQLGRLVQSVDGVVGLRGASYGTVIAA